MDPTQDRWLTRQELANRYQVPIKTIATWASAGTGPRYAIIGHHARYRLSDVIAWRKHNCVTARARTGWTTTWSKARSYKTATVITTTVERPSAMANHEVKDGERSGPDRCLLLMSADNGRAARRGQLPPVGPHPDIEVVFVGALLWSANGHAAVLELVCDDDIGNPTTAAVLTAVRSLVTSGKPVGPQLVYDELRRHGPVRRAVADALRAVTTSGADPAAAWYYGTAVVAAALRRRVESAGVALSAAAREAPEDELVLHVQRAAAGIADCGRRLTELRG